MKTRHVSTPLSTARSRGPRGPTTWWSTPGSRCWTIREFGMELLRESRIQNVVPGNPRSFLRTISFPIYEVFQFTTTTSGIQDRSDLVDGSILLDQRERGFRDQARLCGGRNRSGKVWVRHGMWSEFCIVEVGLAGRWPGWSAFGWWRGQRIWERASCRAGVIGCPVLTARPSVQVGMMEHRTFEGLLSSCTCVELVEGDGVLRPRPSRSLGTSSPPQEHPMAPHPSESSRWLPEGILSVLSPANELVPRVLVVVAEGSQETSNFLNLSLRLPIGLRMVTRR